MLWEPGVEGAQGADKSLERGLIPMLLKIRHMFSGEPDGVVVLGLEVCGEVEGSG